MFGPRVFFDLSSFAHQQLFADTENVWEVFGKLESYLADLIGRVAQSQRIKGEVKTGAKLYGEDIVIEEGVLVESTAYIRGPVYIGRGSKIGPGAFLRGPVVTGENCIIGNSTEAKNTIMLNNAWASHFNYIGDSIFGNNCSLGAGTQLANTKINGRNVRVGDIDTQLLRFGAVLADGVRIGCNAVTDPGTIIGKDCLVLPQSYIRSGLYERGAEKYSLKKIV
jgi:NDP-sugar pyrophosphorylase family protein